MYRPAVAVLVAAAAIITVPIRSPRSSAQIATDADVVLKTADRSFRNEFFDDEVEIGWSGDRQLCKPGTIDPAFAALALRRLNYYRGMAGVSDTVTLSASMNERAQAAALVLSEQGELSHQVPASWRCYSELAALGASTGNIHLGYSGRDAITSFMEDLGPSNKRVGHRRWILFPNATLFGVGTVPRAGAKNSSSVLVVFGPEVSFMQPRPSTREPFVAWPPPGFVPFQVVFDRWSFSLPATFFGAAQVTVSRNGNTIATNIEHRSPENEGYGEDTLVWSMQEPIRRPPPGAVDVYNVEVNVNGTTHTYKINVFDVNRLPIDLRVQTTEVQAGERRIQFVGSLTANDPDNDALTYSLVDGEGDRDNRNFQIDGAQIRLAVPFESTRSAPASIRIRADDQRGGTVEEAIKITVKPVPITTTTALTVVPTKSTTQNTKSTKRRTSSTKPRKI